MQYLGQSELQISFSELFTCNVACLGPMYFGVAKYPLISLLTHWSVMCRVELLTGKMLVVTLFCSLVIFFGFFKCFFSPPVIYSNFIHHS